MSTTGLSSADQASSAKKKLKGATAEGSAAAPRERGGGAHSSGERGTVQQGDLGRGLAVTAAGDDAADASARMGRVELSQYRELYREALKARAYAARADAMRAAGKDRQRRIDEALDASAAAMAASGLKVDRKALRRQLEASAAFSGVAGVIGGGTSADANAELQRLISGGEGGDGQKPSIGGLQRAGQQASSSDQQKMPKQPAAGQIATRLLMARLIDRNKDAHLTLFDYSGAVILLDVADASAMGRIEIALKEVWFLPSDTVVWSTDKDLKTGRLNRWNTRAYVHIGKPSETGKAPADDYIRIATIRQFAIPILAVSPDARTCLPKTLNEVASHRLTLPHLDVRTLNNVIRIVTGKPSRQLLDAAIVRKLSIDDLALCHRPGQTPAEAMAELAALVERREVRKDARALTLDELHGLEAATDWARSTIRDLAAFKAGTIGWADVDHGIVLDGPPGTGKTTFAKVFAAEAGLPLVAATLAQWQGAGPGHLGSLLAAMRASFDDARRQASAVMFIDEIDAFPDRAKLTHHYKDYVIEVVNALLEQLDGLAGRDGLIFIAASNDVSRCDPAILRAGRLNRVVRIELPDQATLAKMFRVRLRDDLKDVDLAEAALLAAGYAGADVERAVKDARRSARHAERPVILADLIKAVAGDDDPRTAAHIRRVAIHEAGHALSGALFYGPEAITANIRVTRGDGVMTGGGVIVAREAQTLPATRADFERHIDQLLAGRVAEELLLGDAGVGSGGHPQSDIARATALAAQLVGCFGLAGPTPLMYRGNPEDVGDLMVANDVRAAALDLLRQSHARVTARLEPHQEVIAAIAERLVARKALSGAELAEIIPRELHALCRRAADGEAASAGKEPAGAVAQADRDAPDDADRRAGGGL